MYEPKIMAQVKQHYNQRAATIKSRGRLLREARPAVITRLLLLRLVHFSLGHLDDEYRSGTARSVE
jgi:hypothetical protein